MFKLFILLSTISVFASDANFFFAYLPVYSGVIERGGGFAFEFDTEIDSTKRFFVQTNFGTGGEEEQLIPESFFAIKGGVLFVKREEKVTLKGGPSVGLFRGSINGESIPKKKCDSQDILENIGCSWSDQTNWGITREKEIVGGLLLGLTGQMLFHPSNSINMGLMTSLDLTPDGVQVGLGLGLGF